MTRLLFIALRLSFMIAWTMALGVPASTSGAAMNAPSVPSNVQAASPPTPISVQIVQPAKSAWLEVIETCGPYVAAVLAFLAAWIILLQVKMDARYTYASEILEYRFRQMQEFYAPALLQIEQSRVVYEKLLWTIKKERQDVSLDGFRLLDHIHKFKSDPNLNPLVERILTIGKQLTNLISEKAGLIEGGIAPTFIDYQAHFEILNAASEQELSSEQKEGWHEYGYYPRMLNREIREGYKVVLAYLDNYANAGDKIINRLLGQKIVAIGQHRRQLIQNLQFYQDHVKEYTARFDAFDLSRIRERFTETVENTRDIRPKNLADHMIRILDVGCGTGRDAYEFLRKGYAVTAVDASPAMLRECRKRLRNAKDKPVTAEMQQAATESRVFEQTFDEITFRNEFDGVWAAAALLHVPFQQMKETVKKLVQAIKPGGILFMSFKYGHGRHEYDARFYSYYGRRDIRALMQRIRCAEEICLWLSDAQGNDLPARKQSWAWLFEYLGHYDRSLWLNVLLRRRYV